MSAPPIGSVIGRQAREQARREGDQRHRFDRQREDTETRQHDQQAIDEHREQQQAVDELLALKRNDLLMSPWSLPKAIMLPLKETVPMMAPTTASEMAAASAFHRRGAPRLRWPRPRRRHAVVERDHLRHVGDGHALAVHQASMPPRKIALTMRM